MGSGQHFLELGEPVGGPYPVPSRIETSHPASVRVPMCLDLATIDSTEKFSGTPGGGGIGIAFDMAISLKIEPTHDWDIQLQSKLPIEHIGRALCSVLLHDGAFRISSPDESAAPFDISNEIAMAVAAGINASLGRPLGQRELRRFVSYNLAKETNGMLVSVPDTGVREAGCLFGGLVIVTDELEIACRTPLPENGNLILIFPSAKAGDLDQGKMVQIDEKDREKKALEVLMRLIPASIKSEVGKMGDSIYRLQLLGSKVVEIRSFNNGKEIYRLMSMLRVKGCSLVGVHAETGVVAAYVQPNALDECLGVIEQTSAKRIITRPENKGMKITMVK